MVRRSSSLPALVAVLATLTGLLAVVVGGAPARAAAARPAAPAPYDPALEVTIDSLAPAYVPRTGRVRVTGTVTNVDEVAWTGVDVYAVLGDSAMVTSDELTAAAESDPLLVVGERITDEGAFDRLGDLEPGASQRYSFSVPRSLLDVTDAGVYWFGVHALGESADEASDTVADGRARTFLPHVPPSTRGEVQGALVVPLRRYLPYAPDGSLDGLEQWQTTLAEGGRLHELVELGADVPGTATWLVDPALVDAVRRLAQGNPPRSIAPDQPPPGDAEPTPGGSPSASTDPDDGTDPDGEGEGEQGEGQEGEQRELTPEEQATAEVAAEWLDDLRSALSAFDDQVLTLPYGDIDVAAAAELAPRLFQSATERTSPVLDEWDVDTTPAVVSPGGFLNQAALDLVDPATTVVVTDRMFGEDPPGVATVDGRRVAVASSGAVAGGPAPGDRFTAVQLRQRLLGESVVRLLRNGRPPLVVVLPTQWQPEATDELLTGLDVDWLDLTTVADVTGREGRTVDTEDLTYPAGQSRGQLDEPIFAAATTLIGAGETLQNLLTRNDQVAAEVRAQALAGPSYGARAAQARARRAVEASTDWVNGKLQSVSIDAGPGVTLSSSDGGFATVIDNALDEPVIVGVEARSVGGMVIDPAEPVEIPARSRTTVVLAAHASRPGVRNVTLRLTDVDGNPIGPIDTVPIRSAQVSGVIWLIIGTGLGLLFLAILVRLFRRIRRARRSRGAATADAADRTGPVEPDPSVHSLTP